MISNEKNRLSFTSLTKRIDSAIEKSYPEREIVDAVINAISPQLHFKLYLEGMKSLSLQELRQILRSHYCEKSATEAYQELTNVVQEPNEAALNFLMIFLLVSTFHLFQRIKQPISTKIHAGITFCTIHVISSPTTTVSAVSSEFYNDTIWVSALSTNEKNITVRDSEKIPPVSDIYLLFGRPQDFRSM